MLIIIVGLLQGTLSLGGASIHLGNFKSPFRQFAARDAKSSQCCCCCLSLLPYGLIGFHRHVLVLHLCQNTINCYFPYKQPNPTTQGFSKVNFSNIGRYQNCVCSIPSIYDVRYYIRSQSSHVHERGSCRKN